MVTKNCGVLVTNLSFSTSALNFDSDDSVLNSPHNLENLLLVEIDKCNGLSKEISSSWKSQNSKQSIFLFARSEGSIERASHVIPLPIWHCLGNCRGSGKMDKMFWKAQMDMNY